MRVFADSIECFVMVAETSTNFLDSTSHLMEFSSHIAKSSSHLSGFQRIF
jgi:hypothetical protein